VGDVTVAYRTVADNGTLNAVADDGVRSDVRTLTGNGGVYLRALGGDLTVTEGTMGAGAGVSAAGSGKVYLNASGSVLVQADVESGSGHVTVAGGSSVSMAGGTSLVTAGGEVSVTGGTGSVTVVNVLTGGGDVRVGAQTGVTLGTVDAGTGSVSVVAATGSILDGTDAGANVTAVAVRLLAGGSIGALNDELALATGLVAVQAGGVVRLGNNGDLVAGSVSVGTATVGADGVVTVVTDGALAGVQAANTVVLAVTGQLALDAAFQVTGTGQALLSATGGVTVAGGVTLANGSVSVLAGAGVVLNAALTVAGGTVELVAMGGNVSTQLVQTAGGNVRVTASGGVSLGLVDVRNGVNQGNWGDVSVTALGGSISDAGADTLVNVYARNVRMSATGDAGTLVPAAADGLEVDAQTVAVSAGGSVNVVALNGLTVGTVGVLSVNRVGVGGGLTASSDSGGLTGVTGVTGVVVRTLNGALAINAVVSNTGSGNVLLRAVGGDLGVTADVTVGNGSLSVLGSGSVTVVAGVTLRVTGGTADVAALGGSVMLAGTVVTAGANIRVYGAVGVSLGLLDARTVADRGGNTLTAQGTWGEVSVTAVAGSVTDAANDLAVDIYAVNLRLVAGVGLGTAGANVVGTEVVKLALAAGAGGINVLEATDVTVGTVGVVTANRVQDDGSVSPLADGAGLTGVVKTGGVLTLDTANGSNIPGFPQFTVLTTLSLGSASNNLTGLYEQRLRIENTTGSTIDAVRVAVGNLPAGVTVANAAGTLVDGRPFLQFNQVLLPGQVAELVVEYKVPGTGSVPTAPAFEVDVVPVIAPLNPAGTILTTGVQVQRLADNRYLLDILTLANRTYYIQYSDDGTTWITVLSPLTGTGGTVSWLDNGPPKSFPDPNTNVQRNYRVIITP